MTTPAASRGVTTIGDALTTPFSLSVLTATRGNASKSIIAGANGQPIKNTGDLAIWRGVLEHVQVPGLAGLHALLRTMQHNQALVHGIVKGSQPGHSAPLVTKDALERAKPGTLPSGTIARSLDFLAYSDNLFVLMWDRDDNPEDPALISTPDQLLALLAPILPGISAAGALITNSTSSAIRDKITQEWLIPPTGYHIYMLAHGNLARFVELLKIRLWTAGHGFCKLGTPNVQTGVASVLERAAVDLMVFSPERLDYVAGARIAKNAPFYQDRGEPSLIPGGILDLDSFPAVTAEERHDYQQRRAAAKADLAPERFQKVKTAIADADPALPPDQVEVLAQQRLQQQEEGYVPDDFLLYFFHRKKAVAVKDLSADYDGKRLADPAEPTYREGADAIFHWHHGDWLINSFPHGAMKTYRAVPTPPPDPDEDDMQDLVRGAAAAAAQHPNGDHGHASPGAEVSGWRDSLLRAQNGEAKETFNNLSLALEHLAPWCTESWFDVVRDRAMVEESPVDERQVWTAARTIERLTAMPIRNLKLVASALRSHCHQQPRDVLQGWLQGLPPWDKVERLTEWLCDYAGVPKTAYTMAVARLLVVSMVARALSPGIQCRSVVIFEGLQDIGKSKLIKTLAGEDWYREVSGTLEGKEAHMLMKGAWVVELSEMDVLLRTEESRVKSFITMCNDEYVPKYANDPIKLARRTVLVGTINPEGDGSYLRDQTGSTRYYPVRVGTIVLEDIAVVREQLFAEALQWFTDHPADWWRMPEDAAEELELTREARRKEGVYEGPRLREWLAKVQAGTTEVLAPFHTEDALRYCFNIPPERWTPAIKDQVGKAIGKCGWTSKPTRVDGRLQRLWHYEGVTRDEKA